MTAKNLWNAGLSYVGLSVLEPTLLRSVQNFEASAVTPEVDPAVHQVQNTVKM